MLWEFKTAVETVILLFTEIVNENLMML